MSKTALSLVAVAILVPVAVIAWPSPRRTLPSSPPTHTTSKERAPLITEPTESSWKSPVVAEPAHATAPRHDAEPVHEAAPAHVAETTHDASPAGSVTAAHDETSPPAANATLASAHEDRAKTAENATTTTSASSDDEEDSSSATARSDGRPGSEEHAATSNESALAKDASATSSSRDATPRAEVTEPRSTPSAPSGASTPVERETPAPSTGSAAERAGASSAPAVAQPVTNEAPVETTSAAKATEQVPAAAQGSADAAPASTCSTGLTGDWDGARTSLGDSGVDIKSSLIFDVNTIAEGGRERDTVGHSFFDLAVTFDLAKLANWSDAHIVADGYIVGGRNPSAEAGDFQAFSNTAAIRVTQLAQLFLEKRFFDQKLRVKLGKADANADFGAPDHGGDFIHTSAAFSPTIVGFTTFPNPSTCVVVSGSLTDALTLDAGVYDGATNAGTRTGGHGPSTFFGKPSDLFYIGEANYTWAVGEQDLAGRFALGVWHHTGNFANFDGSTDDGTSGYYALVDQELARLGAADEPGTLAGFLQWGSADSDVAVADGHVGMGLTASGCCSGRPDDALGFYMSRANFSNESGIAAASETAFEIFYKWKCCDWAVIKPDLQTITNPGGDATLDDALVFSVRVQIDF